MSGMVELSEHTAYLLDSKMLTHEAALAFRRNKDYDKADEAFAQAAETSMSRPVRAHEVIPGSDDSIVEIQREVAYGRILLDWAMMTEEANRHANPEVSRANIQLAFGRALRGLVLLTQDQHGIVDTDELDYATEKVAYLRGVTEAISSNAADVTATPESPSVISLAA